VKGNQRLKVVVDMFLGSFSKAETKLQKGQIIFNVVDTIRSSGGSFVKLKNGVWWEIGDPLAR